MPQDAFTIRLAARELNAALTGGRINRINPPDRDAVALLIDTGKRTVKLLLNANATDCGVYFTEEERENPAVAPNFCMLLRKHLQSAEILSVETAGFERILTITLRCDSDLSACERVLYAEIMGKYSNLILTENGVILGALKTTTADEACRRLILPGAPYVFPAPQEKADPSDRAALIRALEAPFEDTADALFRRVAGLAPCTAAAIAACYAGGDAAALADHVQRYIFSDETQPCVKETPGGVVDFYARRTAGARPFPTLMQAECYYYTKKRGARRVENMRRRLLTIVRNAEKKQEKRLAQILEKRQAAADAETVRLKGELLTANLYALTRGMRACELVNYYDEAGKTIKIALDETLTPAQNAQAYYKKYRKQKRTLEALVPQEKEVREELLYLAGVRPFLLSAETEEDLAAAEEELQACGLAPLPQERARKKKPEVPFRTYEQEGFTVYVGRSNIQNDRLVRQSAPDDVWLHARQVHSAHVVIRTRGRSVPESVLAFAAGLCARFSAGGGDRLPVDCCPIKNVKKPKGSKAGFVTYTDYRTLEGDPARAAGKETP